MLSATREAVARGIKHGDLLRLAEGEFDRFITSDQSIRYRRNPVRWRIHILELSTRDLRRLRGLVPVHADTNLSFRQTAKARILCGMNESKLLERITYNPKIFGGKAIIRGRRLAVEHVLGMLATGHTTESVLADFPWLEREDIQACLLYAKRAVGNERIEPVLAETEA